MCYLLLTSSASLRTRRKLFPSAAFTSSSVHPLRSSSATRWGTLDTSSRPSGSLTERSSASTTYLWNRRFAHPSPCHAVVIATKTNDFCSSHLLYIVKVICEESSNGEEEMTASLSQQLFTCNIRQLGALLAGHVVVVEVHHDDPFFFFLQRWTEEETLTDLETGMYGMVHESVASARSGRRTYNEQQKKKKARTAKTHERGDADLPLLFCPHITCSCLDYTAVY